jgi:hypothetical protein
MKFYKCFSMHQKINYRAALFSNCKEVKERKYNEISNFYTERLRGIFLEHAEIPENV